MRLTDEAARHLERLRANKAQLDLDRQARERREEQALAAFVAACARGDQLAQERDERLAALRAQMDRARADYHEQLGRCEQSQVTALAELRQAGRTVEEIAALVELPRERVKRYLRNGQTASRRHEGPQPAGDAGQGNSDGTAETKG
jgi:hypothetical protein